MDPDQLIVGYQSATAAIRARVVEYARRLWSGSPSLRDEDVERIIARLVPAVQSGQRQVAQLTDAYIARVAASAGVEWSAGLDLEAIVNYRGVPAVEVYRRPAVTAYTALGKGVPYSQAVQQGLSRLMSITSTDMQQAKNRAAAAGIGRSGFEFFRRVLTGSENCALCAIASTQRYRRGDLLPIHPGCDCGVAALFAPSDPGQVIDSPTLELIHDEVERVTGSVDRGGRAPDYRDLVVTNMHGELGPTLGWRGEQFTGPADIGRAAVL